MRVLFELNGGLAARVVVAPLTKLSMSFTWDAFGRMSRSLRLLKLDYGEEGFEFDERGDTDRRELRVTRCVRVSE